MRSRDDIHGPIPLIIDYLKKQVHGASIQEIASGLNLNRNLVAKYLSILHMQGRLDLRSYGNIKIYRLSNKIPFQSLALLTPDLILGIDKLLYVRYCQGCLVGLCKTNTDQIVGSLIFDTPFSTLITSEFRNQIRSIMDGTIFSTPESELTYQGIPITTRLISCIFDDGQAGVALLCSKVRISQEVNTELQRLSSRLFSLINEMREFYIEFSPDWLIITLNSSLSEYCGKSRNEYIGTRGIPLVSSDDMEVISKEMFKAKNGVTDKIQVRVVLDDGSVRWQEWIFYVKHESDTCVTYHGYGWDISDSKLNESKIEMYQSGVEMLLFKKTEELREVTSNLKREIDERRFLEKELIQREELYRNLTESTSDIIWETDHEIRFTFSNGRVQSLLGFTPQEIIGKSPKDFLSKDEYQRIKDIFLKSQSTNSSIDTFRIQILKDDNEFAWLELSGIPVFRPDGTFQGYRGIARDITAKIIAEHQQQQLLSIIESTPDLILMADSDGVITYVNKAGRSILALPEDVKTNSLNYSSLVTSDCLEIIKEGVNTAYTEGSWIKDNVLVSLKGDRIPVSQVILTHKSLSGGKTIISTIARDISDRIRVEQDLAHALAYNRTLIEVSPDPLVTIGPDGTIQDVNHATEIATGLERDQLIGTNFNSYFTEPDKADAGYQLVFSQGFVKNYPLELVHTSGKTTRVLYNAVVYKDEKGNVQGVFAAARTMN